MKKIIVIILGSIFSIFIGFGPAEKNIAKKIKEELGEVDEVAVKISQGSRLTMFVGKIGRIDIKLIGLKTSELKVDELDFILDKIKFNPFKSIFSKEIKLSNIQNISFNMILTETTLQNYLRQKYPELILPRLSLSEGNFKLEGGLKFPRLIPEAATYEVNGYLVAKNNTEIHLYIPDARISILRLPKIVLTILLNLINPIIDISKVDITKFVEQSLLDSVITNDYKPVLKDIKIRDKKLEATGVFLKADEILKD